MNDIYTNHTNCNCNKGSVDISGSCAEHGGGAGSGAGTPSSHSYTQDPLYQPTDKPVEKMRGYVGAKEDYNHLYFNQLKDKINEILEVVNKKPVKTKMVDKIIQIIKHSDGTIYGLSENGNIYSRFSSEWQFVDRSPELKKENT